MLIAFALCAGSAFAQNSVLPGDTGKSVVSFDRVWRAATPPQFTVTVDSSGRGRYVSREAADPPKTSEQGTPEAAPQADPDFTLEFDVSPATRDLVFQLTKDANYFAGDYDYKAHRMADTGKKVLTYAGPGKTFQTTYNWSENKAIDRITKVFQGISNTIEHGRKLQFLKRFDRLGLEAELKGMEEMAQSGDLVEIQIIATTLENIANDVNILNTARQRARRLLALNGS
ncbi:MAG TPA: hypothetical protein VJ723_05250 [Candidatus Angelobacter sp.]|nr:hypothetical protein [Candidatus Angelobacter sp.]